MGGSRTLGITNQNIATVCSIASGYGVIAGVTMQSILHDTHNLLFSTHRLRIVEPFIPRLSVRSFSTTLMWKLPSSIY